MIKRELCWTVCFRETSTPCVCSSRLKLMVWSYRLCFLCLVFVAILSFFFTLLCWKLSVLSSKYIEYTSTHLTRGRFKRNHSHLQAYYQSLNSPKQQSFELHQETQLPFSLWHWSVWLFHKSKCSPSLKWMTTIFAVMTMEMEAGSFFRIHPAVILVTAESAGEDWRDEQLTKGSYSCTFPSTRGAEPTEPNEGSTCDYYDCISPPSPCDNAFASQ